MLNRVYRFLEAINWLSFPVSRRSLTVSYRFARRPCWLVGLNLTAIFEKMEFTKVFTLVFDGKGFYFGVHVR
jgi:hypothetical protein